MGPDTIPAEVAVESSCGFDERQERRDCHVEGAEEYQPHSEGISGPSHGKLRYSRPGLFTSHL
jgi:hypothetical protein